MTMVIDLFQLRSYGVMEIISINCHGIIGVNCNYCLNTREENFKCRVQCWMLYYFSCKNTIGVIMASPWRSLLKRSLNSRSKRGNQLES